jgi:pSer/pThr/pTyr-binding forkhead associated (FHA) protein
MQVKLLVLNGSHSGKEIAIKDEKFLVGRSDECQLRPKSESISRKHCVFVQKEGRVLLADLKSRNGTFINEVRLEPEKAKVLRSGDHIRIGQLDFQIVIELGLGGAKKSEVRSVKEAASRVAEGAGPGLSESKVDLSDIDSWLSEPDSFDRSRLPAAEAPTEASAETTLVRIDAGSSDDTVRLDPAAAAEGDDEKRPPAKKGPMKLPKLQQPGPTTKNSKDAASNALKKYFGGR